MLWHRRAGVQSQGVGVSLPGSAMALAVHACGQARRRVFPGWGQRTEPRGGAAAAAQPTLSPLLSRLAPGRAAPTPSRRRCVGRSAASARAAWPRTATAAPPAPLRARRARGSAGAPEELRRRPVHAEPCGTGAHAPRVRERAGSSCQDSARMPATATAAAQAPLQCTRADQGLDDGGLQPECGFIALTCTVCSKGGTHNSKPAARLAAGRLHAADPYAGGCRLSGGPCMLDYAHALGAAQHAGG